MEHSTEQGLDLNATASKVLSECQQSWVASPLQFCHMQHKYPLPWTGSTSWLVFLLVGIPYILSILGSPENMGFTCTIHAATSWVLLQGIWPWTQRLSGSLVQMHMVLWLLYFTCGRHTVWMSPEVPISADDRVRSISTAAGVANLCALRWLGQENVSLCRCSLAKNPSEASPFNYVPFKRICLFKTWSFQ